MVKEPGKIGPRNQGHSINTQIAGDLTVLCVTI
jgi:hypothetical protein